MLKNTTVLMRITASLRAEETYFGRTTDSSQTFNFTLAREAPEGWFSTTMA